MVNLIHMKKLPILKKIVSGGQTGADRAALDVAIAHGIPHGGWVPAGRIAEDGVIPDNYHLMELASKEYDARTKMNVIDSDGTLVISHGLLTGGSALTYEFARQQGKPCLHLHLNEMSTTQAVKGTKKWLRDNSVHVLNVAGPRASKDWKIYEAVTLVLKNLIGDLPDQASRLPK